MAERIIGIYKLTCDVCGWTGTSNDVLSAPNPFDPQGTIYGCPECKEVEQFKRVCDFDGCIDSNIAGGKPTDNGYMFLCSEHYNASRTARNDDATGETMNETIEQIRKLLGVATTTEALGKIGVLMREESEIEIELTKYKKLVNSIYEIVSVNCTDVGETFAGIQNDIDELRKETFPRPGA